MVMAITPPQETFFFNQEDRSEFVELSYDRKENENTQIVFKHALPAFEN